MGNISWFQFGVFIILTTAIYYILFYYHYYVKGKSKLNTSVTSGIKPSIHKGHDILGNISPLVPLPKTNSQVDDSSKIQPTSIDDPNVTPPTLSKITDNGIEVIDEAENSYLNDFETIPETVEISNSSVDVSGVMFEDNGLELDDLVERFTIPQDDISEEEALIRAEQIDAIMEKDSFVSELVKKSQAMTDYLQINYYKSNEQEKWIDFPNLKAILGFEKEELQESELMDY